MRTSDGRGRVDEDLIVASIGAETASLIALVGGDFLEIDLQGQPVVDGLTGGHVLTHLSREADRMADELLAATGRAHPPFDAERRWDVEYGGLRPGAVLLDDLIESSERLTEALDGIDDWTILEPSIRAIPARRLVQLIIHQADLGRPWKAVPDADADLAVAQLPGLMSAELADIELVALPGRGLVATPTDDGHTVIEGDPRALLAWASGRIAGATSLDAGPLNAASIVAGPATAKLPTPAHRSWF